MSEQIILDIPYGTALADSSVPCVVHVVVAESFFGKIATQRYEQQTATQAAALGVVYCASLAEAKAVVQQKLQTR
jgi:hypothetical protein